MSTPDREKSLVLTIGPVIKAMVEEEAEVRGMSQSRLILWKYIQSLDEPNKTTAILSLPTTSGWNPAELEKAHKSEGKGCRECFRVHEGMPTKGPWHHERCSKWRQRSWR